ncbi:MAG: tRNA lysidine(34) synthetase TilS [Paucibacter sp.]|nr:tRNA lysidine(34) synthetase TilS [Roseateles sp.]
MADSATPRAADRPVFAVAYSGGRDSTALLHACARAAREQGLRVLALHVHHGLSAHADAWLAQCEALCADWAGEGLPIDFRFTRLNGRPGPAQSVEAWAREQRHAALAAMCRDAGIDLLLLAHHRRDQAETFLLQALRGAGAAGLAAMPRAQSRDGLVWARPWLDHPREAVEAYVELHGLRFIDDDSNADTRYARNRLRLEVWPSLNAAWPQAEASLAQSAAWAQEALALQDEVAAADLVGRTAEGWLDVSGLTPARARNALRAWLAQCCGRMPPASLMERLRLEADDDGAWPCADGMLHRYRSRWRWRPVHEVLDGPSQVVKLACAGLHAVPSWRGAWALERVDRAGVAPRFLEAAETRARQGGEQFQKHASGPPRSLKKAWQDAGVPAFLRDGPLLFCGPQLVFAPGLGLDARVLAQPGEVQFSLRWQPIS